jgi:hypothetical protein
VYADPLRIWATTGSQNISLSLNANEKDSFTIVAAITAACTKFPFWMVRQSMNWKNLERANRQSRI